MVFVRTGTTTTRARTGLGAASFRLGTSLGKLGPLFMLLCILLLWLVLVADGETTTDGVRTAPVAVVQPNGPPAMSFDIFPSRPRLSIYLLLDCLASCVVPKLRVDPCSVACTLRLNWLSDWGSARRSAFYSLADCSIFNELLGLFIGK